MLRRYSTTLNSGALLRTEIQEVGKWKLEVVTRKLSVGMALFGHGRKVS